MKISILLFLAIFSLSRYAHGEAWKIETAITSTSTSSESAISDEAMESPAQKHFKRALELNDESNGLDKDKIDAVIEELDKAISSDPNVALFYAVRGDQHALKSRVESGAFSYEKDYGARAIKDYDKCIALSIKGMKLKNYCQKEKANILCDIERMQDGISIYSQLILSTTNSSLKEEIYVSRAQCYRKVRRYDRAIKDYTEAIKITTDSNTKEFYLKSRGDAYSESGQRNRALPDYEAACEICKGLKDCWEFSCKLAFDIKREQKRGTSWEYIASSDDQDWYYEKSRMVVRSMKDVKVWVRVEPLLKVADGKFPEEDFSYIMDLAHFDCINYEVGYSSHISYDKDGKPENTWSGSQNETRQAIVPGSIGDGLREKICGAAKKDEQKMKRPRKKKEAERDT